MTRVLGGGQSDTTSVILLTMVFELCLCLSKERYQLSSPNEPSDSVFTSNLLGARCSSVVRAFGHGAMGRRIDPSWGGPIELFLVPASAPRLV